MRLKNITTTKDFSWPTKRIKKKNNFKIQLFYSTELKFDLSSQTSHFLRRVQNRKESAGSRRLNRECNQILSFVFLAGNCRWTTHSSSRSFSSTNTSLDTYYVFTFKGKPLPLISFNNSMWRMCPKILIQHALNNKKQSNVVGGIYQDI